MPPAPEQALNETLELLRSNIEPATTRSLDDGRIVADIVLPPGENSLGRFMSEKSALAMGTLTTRIPLLVQAGLVQPGGRRGGNRWVALEGAFHYSDISE